MKPDTSDIRDVTFDNPRLARVGVDVVALRCLFEEGHVMADVPERPGFYLLMLVHGGSRKHMVDFVEHRLGAGDVLCVRPGQIQQWHASGTLDASLVLFSPVALAPFIARAEADMQLLALDAWPSKVRPRRAVFADSVADVARLRSDVGRFAGEAIQAALVWHELLALLLRLAAHRDGTVSAPPEGNVHQLFLREMENGIQARTNVRELARRIGCSESTLARACLGATGRTAKQLLDQRVALEAKRLLVHSQATVAAISHQLGFSESTNFVKFFQRLVGRSPLAFRAAHAVAGRAAVVSGHAAGFRAARNPP